MLRLALLAALGLALATGTALAWIVGGPGAVSTGCVAGQLDFSQSCASGLFVTLLW